MTLERDLKAALLLAAPRELPHLRLFNRPVMRVKLHDPERTIQVGLRGQCDLYGLARGGLHIELELKTHAGVMGPKQVSWQTFCQAWCIPHLILRQWSGENVEVTVQRWCGEIREKISAHETSNKIP